MVHEPARHRHIGVHKKHSKEIDGGVPPQWRQVLAADYFHREC
jgi:hypothetical protein